MSRFRSSTLLLLVLCGVLFLDGLDISLVGVALPSIKADLGLKDAQLQWIVSGYVVGYGGLLLLGGRTADLVGRRKTLLVALALFAGASLLGGLTSDPTLLIATRFLKGTAAAFTAPAGLSIITTTFAEGRERNRALSIYAATGASGFSLGLVLGGVMTQIGWRWAFILPAPIALLLFVLGTRFVPDDRTTGSGRRCFDIPGAVTLTAGMLLLVRTVVEAPSQGWTSTSTVGAFVASGLLLLAFVLIEQRIRSPLIRLGILRSSTLVGANLGAMCLFGSYVGFQFIVTLYLQGMNGWSPIKTAVAFLPAGMMIALCATQVGTAIQRFGAYPLLALGFLSMTLGYGLLLRLGGLPAYASVLLPTMLLVGAGIGMSFPSLNVQATNGIADREQGLAAALVQSSTQIGAALVLAVVTAVVSSRLGAPGDRAALLHAYRSALVVVAGVAGGGLLLVFWGLASSRRQPAVSPLPVSAPAD
jgi:MFS family permease